MFAVKSAIEEIGEILFPKYAPAKMAPPTQQGDTPSACPAVAQTTPTVAAVPSAVPVKSDMAQFSRNTASKKPLP